MKIAILTSGILPVPAVKGGAVENLIDYYLDYNDRYHLHDITVYSVGDPQTAGHRALTSDVNHYYYIEIWSLWSKVCKHIHKLIHGLQYYHYTIEYYLARALSDIARKDYDMVIIENRPGYAISVATKTNVRIMLHLHNDFLNADVRNADAIYRSLSRVIAVSDFIRRRVKTVNSYDEKCLTVWNGIDLSNFSSECVQEIDRKNLGLSDDNFVIVYSGRMIKEKGIAELIDAMTLLKHVENIKLLVIGGTFFGDDHHDNDFTCKLKETAKELGNKIVFTGFVPYSDVPAYLKMADVAIIPSQWDEPFGLTCVESMAMSLPVIATDRGGIPEILNECCAKIIPTGANVPERLSAAILYLYHHPDECRAMGQAALTASRRFSKERYAKEFFNSLKF